MTNKVIQDTNKRVTRLDVGDSLVAWKNVSSRSVCHINEVTVRRARLVLGWVTNFRQVYHFGM